MADSELSYKEIHINHKDAIVTVLVDAEDYPLLSRHTWYIRSTTYPNPSKYKGVLYAPMKGRDRWQALIKYVEEGAHKSTGKMIRLGYFWNEDDAARAYNAKIKELRGEFAWLNPVPEYRDTEKNG